MRTDHYYDSCGEGRIHYCRWTPEGEPKAIVQIVHGIAEYAARYDEFAAYLNSMGFLVVAEDHMGHGESMRTGTQGYFAGGWFSAVADTYHLLEITKAEYPELPYCIFGHSMGSFLTRSLLIRYPNSGIRAAVICGTGWMHNALLKFGRSVCVAACKAAGERKPSPFLEQLVFGSYNKRVEHPRTKFDWLNRNSRCVDAYIADPLCGFVSSGGLLRDMLTGILFNQKPENLKAMDSKLPVLFIAGGDDPVGSYGKGVRQTAAAFRNAGMRSVSERIYPMGRHEILNEMNQQEVYADVVSWLKPQLGME